MFQGNSVQSEMITSVEMLLELTKQHAAWKQSRLTDIRNNNEQQNYCDCVLNGQK